MSADVFIVGCDVFPLFIRPLIDVFDEAGEDAVEGFHVEFLSEAVADVDSLCLVVFPFAVFCELAEGGVFGVGEVCFAVSIAGIEEDDVGVDFLPVLTVGVLVEVCLGVEVFGVCTAGAHAFEGHGEDGDSVLFLELLCDGECVVPGCGAGARLNPRVQERDLPARMNTSQLPENHLLSAWGE